MDASPVVETRAVVAVVNSCQNKVMIWNVSVQHGYVTVYCNVK